MGSPDLSTPKHAGWSPSPKSLSPFIIDDSGIWKTGTVSFHDTSTADHLMHVPRQTFAGESYHAKAWSSSSRLTPDKSRRGTSASQAYYEIDDDSEDDFEFSLFGRNRLEKALKKRLTVKEKHIDDYTVPADLKRSGVMGDAEWEAALKLERQRLEQMYYASMVKLNMRLSILSKLIECVSVVVVGFKWSIRNWLSLGVQLFLNTASSSCILYRFKGKYSLPEATVLPELRDSLKRRERRCVFAQSFCKLASAICLIVFSVLAIMKPSQIHDIQAFFRSTYLTAGFSTGGFVSRISLTIWVTFMSSSSDNKSRALKAENAFSWITSLFSFQTAIISYYLVINENNFESAGEALSIGNYVQLGLASVAALLGVRDFWVALYRLRVGESTPLQQEIDTAPGTPFIKDQNA